MMTKASAQTPQVLVGVMPKMGEISTGAGITPFGEMSDRARWSFLRLQMGKTTADDKISLMKEYPSIKKIPKRERTGVIFNSLCHSYNLLGEHQREIQYILIGGDVYAVASTKHLLIPPEEVLTVAGKYTQGLQASSNLEGVVQDLEELPGLKLGFNLFPGDIVTRRAISIGYYCRVISCFNPLTFVGVGHLSRFFSGRINEGFEKVLRIETKKELDDRIRDAIASSVDGLQNLKDAIADSKSTDVAWIDAKILLAAFPSAYSAGEATVKQIWAQYRKEDQTVWGMAMAVSWVARHGEFSKAAKDKFNTGLATAAAAYLAVDDIEKVAEQSQKWLKEVKHIDLSKWL